MKKILLFLSFLLMSIGVFGTDDVVTYTFTSKSWEATPSSWVSAKDGTAFVNNGIQVTTNSTGANATSPMYFTNISKIVVTYNTNQSSGAGNIEIKIGNNTAKSNSCAYSGSEDGKSAYFTTEYDYATPQSGFVKIIVNTNTNSLYIVSIEITYEETISYRVKWVANNDTVYSKNVLRNRRVDSVPMLRVSDYCADKFVGWTVSEYYDNTHPSVLFNNIEQSPRIICDTIFYSVFANFVK